MKHHGDIDCSGDVRIDGGHYYYLRGDNDTDGSVRIFSDSVGSFKRQKRESGSWVDVEVTPHIHATITNGTGLTGGNYDGSTAQTWAVAYGTSAGTACEGNDPRLSDTRSPNYVSAPATPTSSGVQGQRAYTDNYVYECVATNTWVRYAAESSW